MTEQTQPTEIPQDLQDKIGALRALVGIHNLLQEGAFKLNLGPAIANSLKFCDNLHRQLMEEAMAHPAADMVDDLRTAKEQKAGVVAQEQLQKEFEESQTKEEV